MSNGEMTTRLVHSGFTRRTALVLGTPDARRLAGRLAGWLADCIDNHPFMRYIQAIISLRVGRADSLVEQ